MRAVFVSSVTAMSSVMTTRSPSPGTVPPHVKGDDHTLMYSNSDDVYKVAPLFNTVHNGSLP